MIIKQLQIPDVLLIEPNVFVDGRGFFYESFHAENLAKAIHREVTFVQDNHSLSFQNVLRGLHYQLPPMQQEKLVRVISGEIFDVAVDIRKTSPTYGQWVGELLSAENRRQMWIPDGFAHGFLTLSERAEVVYKVTNYYAPDLDRCLMWDDDNIKINWPLPPSAIPILSEKDKMGHGFTSL